MLRGVSDSTASIGFYHSTSSLRSNPAQDQGIPMDYLGINIEGPPTEGFFSYPVCRVPGDVAKAQGSAAGRPPRIYPDRAVMNNPKVHLKIYEIKNVLFPAALKTNGNRHAGRSETLAV